MIEGYSIRSTSHTPTYYDWLKDQVELFDNRGRSDALLCELHSITYIPMLTLDKNRECDGLELRDIYDKEYDGYEVTFQVDTPCSMLEFLVALARRMNYIYARDNENTTSRMFWLMINNVGLSINSTEEEINRTMERIIRRDYGANGEGNLFPLKMPRDNQRNVEVWYQMNQYLIEIMAEEGR